MPNLDELRLLANGGPAERKQYLDALEERYGDGLRAGNARARRLLIELEQNGCPAGHGARERIL